MSRVRVSQDVVEVIQADSGYARISQDVVEVLQAFTMSPIVSTNVLASTAATVSSQATAAHLPLINTLYILTVVAKDAGGANTTPTATHAGGLTWVLVAHVTNGVTGFSTTVFRAMKASGLSSAATTISFGGSSQTIVGWSIDQHTNTVTTGTNGSDALVQSVTGNAATGTSLSITLAALASPFNVSAGSFGHNVNEAVTPGSNYVALGAATAALLGLKTESMYQGSVTVNATWTTTAVNTGIAYEIRAASGFGGPLASFGALVSQHVVEVMVCETTPVARVSQHVVEVMMIENNDPSGPTTSFGYIF